MLSLQGSLQTSRIIEHGIADTYVYVLMVTFVSLYYRIPKIARD